MGPTRRDIDNVEKEENAQVTHESNTPNPALDCTQTNTKETNNRKISFKTNAGLEKVI
jgi:hypothetical protein